MKCKYSGCSKVTKVSSNGVNLIPYLDDRKSVEEYIIGNDVKTIENNAFNECTNLNTTASQPTWDKANGSYSFVDFANSNDMFVRIDYTLTAEDGSGETIAVKDAIVTIPSQYIQWKPNYKYSYIIKVHNSNSYIGEGTPLFDKYPASFDAIVIEDDNGNSTVTTITTR